LAEEDEKLMSYVVPAASGPIGVGYEMSYVMNVVPAELSVTLAGVMLVVLW